MRLMTEALEKRFAEVGEQDIPNPIVVAHFFDPCGMANWFVTAYYPEDREIFGWAEVIPGGGEWGYSSLDELETYNGILNIGVERDLYWQEKRAKEVKEIY
jgi:hypothetical protein